MMGWIERIEAALSAADTMADQLSILIACRKLKAPLTVLPVILAPCTSSTPTGFSRLRGLANTWRSG
jgi:hypothetical protein